MEKQKSEKKANFINVCRNVIYFTVTKAFILFLISVLTIVLSLNCLKILSLYTENPDYVSNTYAQGSKFDYETSAPFKSEIKKCFGNILAYSLKYDDIENFKFSDSIQIHIDDETKRANEQIEIVKYLAGVQIEKNQFDPDYIKKGYIVFEKGADGKKKPTVNIKSIEDYYYSERDELIEGYKKTIDKDYGAVSSYLEELNGVRFAVVDRTSNKIISNIEGVEKSQLKKIFSENENSLMVFNSKNPYYAASNLQNFSTVIEKLAEDYEENFDFYISFDNGLYFNEACKNFESNCKDIFNMVFSYSLTAAITFVATMILFVMMLLIAGKREYKGAVKYCITDRIPNDVHLIFHTIIIASMMLLILNSVYFVLNPKIEDMWMIKLSPYYYLLRAVICCVVLVLMIIALLCSFKRQMKNKTLITNTVIYRFIKAFKRNYEINSDDDENFNDIEK